MMISSCTRLTCSLTALLLWPWLAPAETPQWIWHDNNGASIQTNEVRFFRKTFRAASKPTKALLSVAGDDEAIVFINGKEVATSKGHDKPAYKDVVAEIKKGPNVIAIRGRNRRGDTAGVLAILEITPNKQASQFILTDDTWL